MHLALTVIAAFLGTASAVLPTHPRDPAHPQADAVVNMHGPYTINWDPVKNDPMFCIDLVTWNNNCFESVRVHSNVDPTRGSVTVQPSDIVGKSLTGTDCSGGSPRPVVKGAGYQFYYTLCQPGQSHIAETQGFELTW